MVTLYITVLYKEIINGKQHNRPHLLPRRMILASRRRRAGLSRWGLCRATVVRPFIWPKRNENRSNESAQSTWAELSLFAPSVLGEITKWSECRHDPSLKTAESSTEDLSKAWQWCLEDQKKLTPTAKPTYTKGIECHLSVLWNEMRIMRALDPSAQI